MTERRGLLKKGAIAAAAVAAAGVATSSPAAAANGDTITVGGSHTGTTDTRLSGSTFRVTGGGGDAAMEGVGNTEGLHGVYGRAVSSNNNETYGVYGLMTGSQGAGVYGATGGSSQTGYGVHGKGTRGVYGEGYSIGVYGVGGSSSASGIGVQGVSATGPSLLLSSVTRTMPPTTGTWTSGSFINNDGALWYCTRSGTGTDAEWREMTATAAAAPAMNVLATPTRVYDAREGFAPASGTKGAMSGDGIERVIDTTSTGVVPASASAVFANLTFVNGSGDGFVAIFANGVAWPGSSNLNPSGSGTVANMVVTATDAAGMVTIRTGGSVSGHPILDVFAYLA